MNAAHLHLIINHIPVVGVALGVLLLVVGLFRKNEPFLKAGMVLFIVCALMAIPTYLSGEGAEDVVEHLQGVSEVHIGPHETIGFYAMIGTEVLGVLSLMGLVVFRKKSLSAWFVNLILVISIMVSGVLSFTAKLGGEIHHPEIRSGFIQ